MRVTGFALALTLAGPAMAQDAPLRDLTTDRPDKTEAAQTVDAGHIQLEMDLATWTSDRASGVRTDTLSLAPFNLKYGIGRSTDVQLVVEPYLVRTETDRATAARRRVAGFGDVTLRVKHNLWGNDANENGGTTALAVMPFVTLPTNARDLGSRKAEFGLIVPLSVALSGSVDLGLMTELDMVENGRGYAPSFVNSATLGFSLTDRLGLYTEIFTERTAARAARWVVTGDAGLTYRLIDNLQLDAGANIGLTRAADDVQVFVGLSRRF